MNVSSIGALIFESGRELLSEETNREQNPNGCTTASALEEIACLDQEAQTEVSWSRVL
jgi:hypothetical protein